MLAISHASGVGMPGIPLNSTTQEMLRAVRINRLNPERLMLFRRFLREDPGAKYDLKTAFDVDPERDGELAVKRGFVQPEAYVERSRSEINRIRKLKHRKYQVSGELVGVRIINTDIPRRIRERLMIEAMRDTAQFVIGRFGLSDSIVTGIRRAFCYKEVVRLTVDSPWRDNMKVMALRIEERTGGMIVDRAGGRVFLYRGFTDADLARKGLLSPQLFHDVAVDYSLLREANETPQHSPSSPMNVIRPDISGIKVNGTSPDKKTLSADGMVSANNAADSSEGEDEDKHGNKNTEGQDIDGKQSNVESSSHTMDSLDMENSTDAKDEEFNLHPDQLDLYEFAEPRDKRSGKTDEEIEIEHILRSRNYQGPIGEDEESVDDDKLEQVQRIMKLAKVVERGNRGTKKGRKKKHFRRKP